MIITIFFSSLKTFFLPKSKCPNKESYSKYRTILQSDLQYIKITIKHLENKVEKAENRFKNRQAQEKGILITPYKYSFYSYDSLSVNVPAL